MKTLNKAILIGRLGKDPEIKYTHNGTPVANLHLATDRAVKKGNQWEKETDWHRITAWKDLAEICERYLTKGSLIYVEGQIRTRSWDEKDGSKKYVTEIWAKDIKILDSKGETPGCITEQDLPMEDIPF